MATSPLRSLLLRATGWASSGAPRRAPGGISVRSRCFSAAFLVRGFAWLLLGVTLGGVCAGCGDRSRRLGEREALEYKTALLRSRQAEVAPGQTKRFFYHPARTPAEIDRAFNDLAREHAADAARERAAFTGSSSGGSALTRQKEDSSGESSVEGGGEGDGETSEERAGAPVEDVGGR